VLAEKVFATQKHVKLPSLCGKHDADLVTFPPVVLGSKLMSNIKERRKLALPLAIVRLVFPAATVSTGGAGTVCFHDTRRSERKTFQQKDFKECFMAWRVGGEVFSSSKPLWKVFESLSVSPQRTAQ
jgi:hypothetical protein